MNPVTGNEFYSICFSNLVQNCVMEKFIELAGFQFLCNNKNRSDLEKVLNRKREIPPDRQKLLKEIESELPFQSHGNNY